MLYIISLLCIVNYFTLDNSSIIPKLVEKSSEFRYHGFLVFFITGLFKYGLLTIGISLFIILSYLLIKEKISKDN